MIPQGPAPDGSPEAEAAGSSRRALIVSRFAEQGVLGLGSVAMARFLGVDGFVGPALVLLVNSFAVTLADLGVGADLLRLGPGEHASAPRLRAVRRVNGAIFAIGLVVAMGLDGSLRQGALAVACVWPLAAEAHIRKCGGIRVHQVRSVAAGEIAGAVVLGAFIVLACASSDVATGAVIGGLVAKSIVECVVVRGWSSCFAEDGTRGDQLALWLAQVVAYGIANLDYLAVGVLIGERAFAVYSLAFRISSAVPSQLTYVAARTASVDLASGPDRQEATYLRYARPLFAYGVVATVLAMLAAPLVTTILGDEWSSLSVVLVVLAVGIPWRMVLNLGGVMLIVSRRSDLLLRVEVVHFVVFALALWVAGAVSFAGLVGVASAGSVVAVLGYHGIATNRAGIRLWRPLWALAAVSVVAIAALATRIGHL